MISTLNWSDLPNQINSDLLLSIFCKTTLYKPLLAEKDSPSRSVKRKEYEYENHQFSREKEGEKRRLGSSPSRRLYIVHGRQYHEALSVAEIFCVRSCTVDDEKTEEMLELSTAGDDLRRRESGELIRSRNNRIAEESDLSSSYILVFHLLHIVVQTMIFANWSLFGEAYDAVL